MKHSRIERPLSIPIRKQQARQDEIAYRWIIGALAAALWAGVFIIALLQLRGAI